MARPSLQGQPDLLPARKDSKSNAAFLVAVMILSVGVLADPDRIARAAVVSPGTFTPDAVFDLTDTPGFNEILPEAPGGSSAIDSLFWESIIGAGNGPASLYRIESADSASEIRGIATGITDLAARFPGVEPDTGGGGERSATARPGQALSADHALESAAISFALSLQPPALLDRLTLTPAGRGPRVTPLEIAFNVLFRETITRRE